MASESNLRAIEAASDLLAATLARGGLVLSCGNGGSMCDAMHFAEELTGRFRANRKPLRALAISDPGYLSCVANDYGYSEVFARFVSAHGRPSDVLVAISTSGTSENVLKAAECARGIGMKVIALTGKAASPLGKLADIEICALAGAYADRVQELHIKIIHILIELIERRMFPSNYASINAAT
ncbi:MAG: SIS domain-containing protein [Planctomycetota bacterium]